MTTYRNRNKQTFNKKHQVIVCLTQIAPPPSTSGGWTNPTESRPAGAGTCGSAGAGSVCFGPCSFIHVGFILTEQNVPEYPLRAECEGEKLSLQNMDKENTRVRCALAALWHKWPQVSGAAKKLQNEVKGQTVDEIFSRMSRHRQTQRRCKGKLDRERQRRGRWAVPPQEAWHCCISCTVREHNPLTINHIPSRSITWAESQNVWLQNQLKKKSMLSFVVSTVKR